MKRSLPLALAATLAAIVALPVAAATKPALGKSCTTAGQTSGALVCTQSGARKTWQIATATTLTPVTAPPTTAAPVATAAPAAAPANEKLPTRLVFAPVPAENAVATAANWAPWVKAVSDAVGIPIEQVASTDYAGVTEGVLAGKVDIASYGPLSYYIATQAGAKIRGVAIQSGSFGAPATYQSYLFTKAGRSDINTISDVRGKKVCFGDPESTSGTLFPYLMLADAGIDSQKDITNVVAGAHDKSILGVANGSCDAGFAFDTITETPSGAAAGVKGSDLKIIAKSKPIPNSPIAVRSDLPASLFKKLATTIPQIDALYLQAKGYCPTTASKCGPGVLTGIANQSWVAQTNDDWLAPIAAACKLPAAPSSCRPAKR